MPVPKITLTQGSKVVSIENGSFSLTSTPNQRTKIILSALDMQLEVQEAGFSPGTIFLENNFNLETTKEHDFSVRVLGAYGKMKDLTFDNYTEISETYRLQVEKCRFNQKFTEENRALIIKDVVSAVIDDCIVTSLGEGIKFVDCQDIFIKNLKSASTGTHLIFENCRNITVEDCYLDGGTLGIEVRPGSRQISVNSAYMKDIAIGIVDLGLFNNYHQLKFNNVSTEYGPFIFPETKRILNSQNMPKKKIDLNIIDPNTGTVSYQRNVDKLKFASNVVNLEDNGDGVQMFIDSGLEEVIFDPPANLQTTFNMGFEVMGEVLVQLNDRFVRKDLYSQPTLTTVELVYPVSDTDYVRILGMKKESI